MEPMKIFLNGNLDSGESRDPPMALTGIVVD